jgi:hypothetical protein
MDDFGDLISDSRACEHGAGRQGFAAFMLCSECNLSTVFYDELLRAYGVVV